MHHAIVPQTAATTFISGQVEAFNIKQHAALGIGERLAEPELLLERRRREGRDSDRIEEITNCVFWQTLQLVFSRNSKHQSAGKSIAQLIEA